MLPLAGRERDAGQRGDEQRAVAERPPAQAELAHGPAAARLVERPDRGDAHEDQGCRAADPHGCGQQMHGDEDALHSASG